MITDCLHPPARRITFALLLLGLSATAHAQTVYKCIDRDDHIAFQATPCAPSQHAQRIEIAAPPPVMATPVQAEAKPKLRAPRTSTRQTTAPREISSFECRSASGALFYRHSGCPSSIPKRGNASGTHRDGASDRVRATRIPRSDACKRMRSPGRDGREHDESVSTYERNLGRDPCRRH